MHQIPRSFKQTWYTPPPGYPESPHPISTKIKATHHSANSLRRSILDQSRRQRIPAAQTPHAAGTVATHMPGALCIPEAGTDAVHPDRFSSPAVDMSGALCIPAAEATHAAGIAGVQRTAGMAGTTMAPCTAEVGASARTDEGRKVVVGMAGFGTA